MEFDRAKLQWLEYDLLEPFPHLLHATFTRHGGVSNGRFSTLNLGEGTADNHESIRVNREHVRKALGLEKIVYPHQEHGVVIQRVTSKNQEQTFHADALYTTEKNIGLAGTHADCQVAIFYDPVHEAIAIAHCGWRGNAQNIYARLIETLHRDLGTQPHNLIVSVSPSLGPCHSEFVNYKQEFPKELWDFSVEKLYPIKTNGDKYPTLTPHQRQNHFDLWRIGRSQLEKAGVLPKNIEMAELCTHCETEDYFSHRAEKDTGRNATIIALKS
jgi:YfiH family protein